MQLSPFMENNEKIYLPHSALITALDHPISSFIWIFIASHMKRPLYSTKLVRFSVLVVEAPFKFI